MHVNKGANVRENTLCEGVLSINSGRRSSSGKRMEKNSKRSKIGSLDKVKSRKEVILEAQRYKNKVHFASLMDRCHLKKRGVETKISEVQGQSRSVH